MMAAPVKELNRRIFHMVGGLFLVGLIYYDILDYKITAIALALLVGFSFIAKKTEIPGVARIFEKLDRPKDFKKMPGKGAIFYLIGVLIALVIFPKNIAMASIIILALGDSIAPLAGRYGSIESPFNKRKIVEGGIVGALVAAIGAMFFVPALQAWLGAIAAMIAEGVDLRLGVNQVDDNIIMPLVAGIVMILVGMLL